jgi:hypothetical protein
MANHSSNPRGYSRKQGPSVQVGDYLLQPRQAAETGRPGGIAPVPLPAVCPQKAEFPHPPADLLTLYL